GFVPLELFDDDLGEIARNEGLRIVSGRQVQNPQGVVSQTTRSGFSRQFAELPNGEQPQLAEPGYFFLRKGEPQKGQVSKCSCGVLGSDGLARRSSVVSDGARNRGTIGDANSRHMTEQSHLFLYDAR